MGSYNIYRYIEGMNIHDRPVAYSSDFEIGMIKELRVKFSSAHTVEDFDFVSHKMSSKKKVRYAGLTNRYESNPEMNPSVRILMAFRAHEVRVDSI